MGAKRKPKLEDAGKIVFRIDEGSSTSEDNLQKLWESYSAEERKKYTKLAIEIWQSVERCV